MRVRQCGSVPDRRGAVFLFFFFSPVDAACRGRAAGEPPIVVTLPPSPAPRVCRHGSAPSRDGGAMSTHLSLDMLLGLAPPPPPPPPLLPSRRPRRRLRRRHRRHPHRRRVCCRGVGAAGLFRPPPPPPVVDNLSFAPNHHPSWASGRGRTAARQQRTRPPQTGPCAPRWPPRLAARATAVAAEAAVAAAAAVVVTAAVVVAAEATMTRLASLRLASPAAGDPTAAWAGTTRRPPGGAPRGRPTGRDPFRSWGGTTPGEGGGGGAPAAACVVAA